MQKSWAPRLEDRRLEELHLAPDDERGNRDDLRELSAAESGVRRGGADPVGRGRLAPGVLRGGRERAGGKARSSSEETRASAARREEGTRGTVCGEVGVRAQSARRQAAIDATAPRKLSALSP